MTQILAFVTLQAAANKPAATVTDDEALALLAALEADSRVRSVRWLADIRLYDIDAIDFQQGPLIGAYSFGRVAAAALYTKGDWDAYLAQLAAERERAAVGRAARRAEWEAYWEANLAALKSAGHQLDDLIYAIRCMQSGRRPGDEDSDPVRAFTWHADAFRGMCGNCDLGIAYGLGLGRRHLPARPPSHDPVPLAESDYVAYVREAMTKGRVAEERDAATRG